MNIPHKHGSILGGFLMIAGSCIGAGMLALPVITAPGGFFPALFFFVIAWLFMMGTAFALLEVNCTLGYHLSLISLTKKTLGKWGALFAWFLFLFLFYSLGVAYISASGLILQSILRDLTGITFPSWMGSLLFTLLFGYVVYLGTRKVDHLNRALMVGLILTYLLLVLLGLPYVDTSLLFEGKALYAMAALPILVISFGFHNMIPSLVEYFHGDIKRLKIAIFLGSISPLIIYLLFELVILGLIPNEGREGLLQALNQGEAATIALRKACGLQSVTLFADSFALFAIITSFLTQSLSLVDFLSDGLKVAKTGVKRFFLIFLTLTPSFLFAFLHPGLFLKALNVAGGFSATLLFGAIPVLMLWIVRKQRKIPLSSSNKIILPLLFAFSLFVFGLETMQEAGLSLIPHNVEATP